MGLRETWLSCSQVSPAAKSHGSQVAGQPLPSGGARAPPVGGPGHGRKRHITRDKWDRDGRPVSLARAAGPSAAKDRYPEKGMICVPIKYRSKSLRFPVGISLNLLLSSALGLLAPTLCLDLLTLCLPSFISMIRR